MGFRIIEIAKVEPKHDCRSQLPRRGPFWNRNPVCTEGTVIQCDRCDKKYKWGQYNHKYNGLVYRGWREIRKTPMPPTGQAPGAKIARIVND